MLFSLAETSTRKDALACFKPYGLAPEYDLPVRELGGQEEFADRSFP
jgi:hypothetical protein